jgi:hypothetical protein
MRTSYEASHYAVFSSFVSLKSRYSPQYPDSMLFQFQELYEWNYAGLLEEKVKLRLTHNGQRRQFLQGMDIQKLESLALQNECFTKAC